MKSYVNHCLPKRLLILRICIIPLILSLLSNCNSGKQKSMDDKKEVCKNRTVLAYLASSRPRISGSFTFQYSCSASSGYSPSCYEYFSSVKKDDLCQIGYSKTKSKCSKQNLIGICRYVPKETTNLAVTIVFSKPGDNLEDSTTFCASPDINGVFTQDYREPTASADDYNQTIINFLVCTSEAEKK